MGFTIIKIISNSLVCSCILWNFPFSFNAVHPLKRPVIVHGEHQQNNSFCFSFNVYERDCMFLSWSLANLRIVLLHVSHGKTTHPEPGRADVNCLNWRRGSALLACTMHSDCDCVSGCGSVVYSRLQCGMCCDQLHCGGRSGWAARSSPISLRIDVMLI